jgi:tetratricopeptide (TPR) repeat protein
MAQARLEALAGEERLLLRAASVLGEVFWAGAVAALVGEPAPAVTARLEALVEREVLVERPGGRFPGEREFAFRHAFLRDGAHGMLTAEDRRAGHRLAGEWLAGQPLPEPLVVADHFERAGEPARAAPWLVAAAAAALEANDFAGVLAAATRGVAAGAQGDDLVTLRMHELDARGWLGQRQEALALARELARTLPRGTAGWFRAASTVSLGAIWTGDLDALEEHAGVLVDMEPDDAGFAWYLVAVCRASIHMCIFQRRDRAPRFYRRAMALAPRAAGDPALSAWIAEAQGFWAVAMDYDVPRSLASFQQARALFRRAGDTRNACAQSVNVHCALIELGLNEEAARDTAEAIAEGERLGLTRMLAHTRANHGIVLSRVGRLDEALATTEQAIAEMRSSRDIFHEVEGLLTMAQVHLAARRFDAVADAARRAMELQKEHHLDVFDPAALLAAALAGAGQLDEAQAVLDRGRPAGLMSAVFPFDFLTVRPIVQARLCLARGEAARARAVAAEALARVHAQADRFGDQSYRRTYLEDVPGHRELAALAQGCEK